MNKELIQINKNFIYNIIINEFWELYEEETFFPEWNIIWKNKTDDVSNFIFENILPQSLWIIIPKKLNIKNNEWLISWFNFCIDEITKKLNNELSITFETISYLDQKTLQEKRKYIYYMLNNEYIHLSQEETFFPEWRCEYKDKLEDIWNFVFSEILPKTINNIIYKDINYDYNDIKNDNTIKSWFNSCLSIIKERIESNFKIDNFLNIDNEIKNASKFKKINKKIWL